MTNSNATREKKLAEDKLISSGLTGADAGLLNLSAHTGPNVATMSSSFRQLPALKIPYFNIDGTPMRPWPKHPQFYRIRYLEEPKDYKALKGEKPQRYGQPAETGVAAYFPLNADWQSIAKDKERPIIITEGELKAAKACKEGFACIGLGGVYSFKSSRYGVTFLPCLDKEVDWVGRHVFVCYDSDFRSNQMVCAALVELCEELMERGAFPHVVCLPDVIAGGKTGLDDFLVAQGSKEFTMLLEGASPLTLAKPLFEMNKGLVYVRDPGLVLVKNLGQKLAPAAFKDHVYANQNVGEYVFGRDGAISLRKTSAAGSWLKWPLRSEAARLTYKPGAERLITTGQDLPDYNLWSGWGCQPEKGDASQFVKLVDHIFTGAEKGAKEWFLSWLAYPIKYPGVKLYSSVVIHGIKHGTGKSLLAYTMQGIYGKNFTELNQRDLHSGFNEWAECKQFVLADDVTGSNKREDADILKKLITQKTMRINQKYVPSYEVPDVLNYYFTSNQPDAVFLEDDDRRYFIHEVRVPPLLDDFYTEYDLWLESGEGYRTVFQYLLDYDTGDFNPAARAFHTSAKDRMVSDVKSDLGAFVAKLISDPDTVLRVGESAVLGDLFTNKQLLSIYDPTGRTGTTANGLGRELRRAGVPQVLDGKVVRAGLSADRYYILRGQTKWLTSDLAAVTRYVNQLQSGMTQDETQPQPKARRKKY